MVFVFFCLFYIKKNLNQTVHWWLLLLSFGLRVVVGLFFLFVYTEIYGGGELTADAKRFMEESKAIFDIHALSPSTFWSIIFHLPSLASEAPEVVATIPHWVADDAALLNDSQNVLRWNAVLHFVSGGNIIFHTLFFATLTFAASIDLLQFLIKYSKLPIWLLFLLCTLTPSLAFWGANMLKEPFLFIGLCLLIRGVFDAIHWRRRLWRISLGLLLMVMFKPYVLIAFSAGVAFYFFSHHLLQFLRPWKKLLTFVVVGITVFFMTGFHQSFVRIVSKQQEDFINVRDGGIYLYTNSDSLYHIYEGNISNVRVDGNSLEVNKKTTVAAFVPKNRYNLSYVTLYPGDQFDIKHNLGRSGSGITVLPIDNSLTNMIKMVPMNLVNVVLRPLPTDPGNWLKHLSFLENLLIITVSLLALKFRRKDLTDKSINIFFAMLLFVFILFQFIGWTTPVLGAVVRYKAPALFAWLIVIALCFDWQRFSNAKRIARLVK